MSGVKHRSGTGLFVRWLLLPASLFAACGGSETGSSTIRDDGAGRAGSSGRAGARQDASGGGAGATGSGGAGVSSGAAGSIGSADASGSTGSAGTAANGGSAGSSASAGSSGAQGSAGIEGGAVDIRSPRRCGNGLPCAPGAECGVSGYESGSTCKCDPSGHYFCDIWASAGAGGAANCPRTTGCALPGSGGTAGGDNRNCSLSNGFCTRTCACASPTVSPTCTMDCSGTGPAPYPGTLCDRSLCQNTYSMHCAITDGACVYSVECNFDGTPTVTGRCD
jgi:hypothetical protein